MADEDPNAGNTNHQAPNGLTPKQEQAIIELLAQPSVRKAAEVAGVGERTLYRWLEEPAFAAAYKKTRREAFKQAMGLTQRYAPVAVSTLAQITTDKTAPHSARVSAAQALLKFSRESLELDDLAERISALEHAGKSTTPERPISPRMPPPAPEPPTELTPATDNPPHEDHRDAA